MIVTLTYEECRYIQKQLNFRLDFLVTQEDSKFKRSESELCLSCCDKVNKSIRALLRPAENNPAPMFKALENEIKEQN